MVGDGEVHVARRRRSARGPRTTGRRRSCRRPCGRRPSCTGALVSTCLPAAAAPVRSIRSVERLLGVLVLAQDRQQRQRERAQPVGHVVLAWRSGARRSRRRPCGRRRPGGRTRRPGRAAAASRRGCARPRPACSSTSACCSAVSALNAALTLLTPQSNQLQAVRGVKRAAAGRRSRPSVRCSATCALRRARPSARAARGSRAATRIARASSPGRSGATSRPCSPSVISSRTAGRSEATTGTPAAIDSRIFSGAQPCTTLREQSFSGASDEQRVLAPAGELVLGQREVPVHAVVDLEPLGELAVRLGAALVHRRADHQVEVVEVAQAGERAQRRVDALPRLQRAEVEEVALRRVGRRRRRVAGRSAPLRTTCGARRRARAAARRSPATA